MADSFITNLNSINTTQSGDLLVVVVNPNDLPQNKKITVKDFLENLNSGVGIAEGETLFLSTSTRIGGDANTTTSVSFTLEDGTGENGYLLLEKATEYNLSVYNSAIQIVGNLQLQDKLILKSDPPSSASAEGVEGEITWDSTHVYVCVADNTWKRTQLTTW